MKLGDLINFIKEGGAAADFFINGACGLEITGVTHDSSKVRSGFIFACVEGETTDGHIFAPQALQNGAAALCCSRKLDLDIPQIIVPEVRKFMGRLAAALYDYPCEKLTTIAMTGTNGKTTSTYMMRSILENYGLKTGLIGTIVYNDGAKEEYADRTTPENTDTQLLLSQIYANGCKACVMEASSHGLEQGRIEGCKFDAAGFTNLTPEHLDFHGSIEKYFAAKSLLFEKYMKTDWVGIANADDDWGSKLIASYNGKIKGFSKSKINLKSENIEGIAFDMTLYDGARLEDVHIPMIGAHNVSNAHLCANLAHAMKIEACHIAQGLKKMPQVPGRLERYSLSNGVTCFIDYAHSPDALEKALSAVKPFCKGNFWSVFGFGGNRYAQSRPVMGAIASNFADKIVLTMDNPRSEDPRDIAEQIKGGFKSNFGDYKIIINREEAVIYALNNAAAGDVVVISGKGPEPYITFADYKVPYMDSNAVKSWASWKGLTW